MTSALFWRVSHSSSSTLQVKERVLEIRRDRIDALGWTQGRDENARALLTSECKWVPFKQFKFSHSLWDLKSSFTRSPDLFPRYLKISLSFRTAISVVSMIKCLRNLLSWSPEYCSETWIWRICKFPLETSMKMSKTILLVVVVNFRTPFQKRTLRFLNLYTLFSWICGMGLFHTSKVICPLLSAIVALATLY